MAEHGPAPAVARFDGVDSGEAERAAPVARLDELTDQAAAPVAALGEAGASAAPASPIAGLAGLGVARPELPRVMRLSELSAPASARPSRERSPREEAAPRRSQPARPRRSRAARPRDEPPGPGFGPGPEDAFEEARPEPEAPAEPPTHADPVAAAKDICLRLLTDRARTRQELAQALRRKGIPDDAAGTVLERFDEVGLIDDAAFAGQWVRSRHTYKGLARRAIAIELRRKGVADDVAGEALAEVDAASEEQRAEELVRRKLRSLTVTTPEQKASATRRLVGMLARKGYSAGTAYRVVKDVLAEHDVELEEFGAD